ncbi:MAG: alanine dehydrogenase [Flammeovirgaceae bacterium]|jgi:alanine dehydrogenase|nr:alanine dehydrogenase [Flammeovirgaceae bacterium]|tara:strand:- start:18740 stop:19966 length:1227 start_codon:yes stop_codon:yes gene_type:complete
MALGSKSGFKEMGRAVALYPQEKPLKKDKSTASLSISVPLETAMEENRVSLKPESVEILVQNGHQVFVEASAGNSANFTDNDYSEVGARIVYDRKEIFQSDVILKVEPPSLEEISLMRSGAALISALQPGTQTAEYMQAIQRKKIIGLAYEFIEDKVGGLPLVRSMSEIAGSSLMLIAAELLSNANSGQGVILGGVTGVAPTKVVIIGAGTVAEYATRAALGLGVDLQIFDNRIYKLRRLKHAVGWQVHTSTFDNPALGKALESADVLIGAMRIENGMNSVVVSEEMIAKMKPNSLVIDVSIDQGGCIESSHPTTLSNPTFRKYDVVHYCVPNIASRVPRTASIAISNILTPILIQIGEVGGIDEMIFMNRWFMKGVYSYKGSTTNRHLANKYQLNFKDLRLLMAARF